MKYGSGSFAGAAPDIKSAIMEHADSDRALILARFFKTADGEYGAGDMFLGLTVPKCREVSKSFYSKLSLPEIKELLHSKWHEERQIALFMMVLQFDSADEKTQKQIYDMFLANTKYINNWDLVDCNAPRIVGKYMYEHQQYLPVLDKLAESELLWDRRIAVISTMYFTVKGGDPTPTLRIVEKLLPDGHDLIQKANGWMLREVGKRIDAKLLIDFLQKHYDKMPRTTLRYAIEKFNPATRARFLTGKFE